MLSDVIKFFKALSPAQRDLLSEVCTLLRLMLVMPATNAVRDHSVHFVESNHTYVQP